MRKALLVPAAVLMIAAGAPSMATDQPGTQKAHKDNPTQIHGDQPGTQKAHKDNPTQGPIGGPGTQGHKDNPTQHPGGPVR